MSLNDGAKITLVPNWEAYLDQLHTASYVWSELAMLHVRHS